MSYILDALRKSEQERLAQQTQTIAGSITMATEKQSRRPTWTLIIIVLIIVNMITLAYLFINRTPETTGPVMLNKQQTSSMLVLEDKASSETIERPTPTPKKTIIKPTRIIEPLNKAQVAAETRQKQPVTIKSTVKAPPPTKPQPRPIAVKPVKQQYPLLNELPYEFRRSVPQLNINVYVYNEDPAQSFVIINMQKYRVGEDLPEMMKLKEIRSDSLVINYKKQTFRIKRP